MVRASLLVLFALACLLHHQQVWAQVGKLYPVDEAYRDPSFFVFRARLMEAIQQRDEAFVLSILSPDITNSFGGDGGVEEFKEQWQPQRTDSALWKELMAVLVLGGSFRDNRNGRYFTAPYTVSNFPDFPSDVLEVFQGGVILGENVLVRQEPTADSPTIATLSFDIVKVGASNLQTRIPGVFSFYPPKQGWIKVQVEGGLEGFVPEEYIRYPLYYRAVFMKREGRWLLSAFVAGD